MTLSKDGIIVQWNKHLVIEKVKQPEHTFRPRPKWITDFTILQVFIFIYLQCYYFRCNILLVGADRILLTHILGTYTAIVKYERKIMTL